jgi:hypothetical protein
MRRYFLTFCSAQRQALFVERDLVDVVLLQIARSAEQHEMGIIAYCFMPGHVHLLLKPDVDQRMRTHSSTRPSNDPGTLSHVHMAGSCGSRAITIEFCGTTMRRCQWPATFSRIQFEPVL